MVNCEKEQSLCQSHGIKGYPSIVTIQPGTSGRAHPKQYQGGRGGSELRDYALQHLKSHVHTVRTQQQLDTLMEQCTAGKAKGKGRAASGLCVLLITSKSTSSAYKALSNVFYGKVAFGQISEEVAKGLTALQPLPDKRPALLLVCNGNLAGRHTYQVRCRRVHTMRTWDWSRCLYVSRCCLFLHVMTCECCLLCAAG